MRTVHSKSAWHYHSNETSAERTARLIREAEEADFADYAMSVFPMWEDAHIVTHEDFGDWAGDHKRDLGRRG